MIYTIAVLITCFNRKDKTVECIRHLFESKNACSKNFEMDVYLTDDGSTDGTSNAIRNLFPTVNIIAGNGNLFWTGGMRIAWEEAFRSKEYDGFLLLNDDTKMDQTCIDGLINTHYFSMAKFGKGGIYIGSVQDQDTLRFTYGGRIILNKWTYALQNVLPDGNFNECHLGNANIMFVHRTVVGSIGIFSNKYIHAKADYDYTLRALEMKIPVLVCPTYCGYCSRDHSESDPKAMNLKDRIKYLKSPKGVELSGYMYYMWRFFPLRAPFVYCSLWLQTFIPYSSTCINKIMGR